MNTKEKAAHGSKTEAASEVLTKNLTSNVRQRLCRLIDPSGFFNADASLEIDRLTVENELLRARLATLGAA